MTLKSCVQRSIAVRTGSCPLSIDRPVARTMPLNATDPKLILIRPDPAYAVPSAEGVPMVHRAAPIFQ